MDKKPEKERTVREFFELWLSIENIVKMLPLLESLQVTVRRMGDRVHQLENVKPLYIADLEKENKALRKRIKALEDKAKEKKPKKKKAVKPE